MKIINLVHACMQALHSIGLRKFLLAGIGPLGCIPYQRATAGAPGGSCVDSVNQMLGTFNEGLKSMAKQFNADHQGSIFVYGNDYGALGDMLNNPASYGTPIASYIVFLMIWATWNHTLIY